MRCVQQATEKLISGRVLQLSRPAVSTPDKDARLKSWPLARLPPKVSTLPPLPPYRNSFPPTFEDIWPGGRGSLSTESSTRIPETHQSTLLWYLGCSIPGTAPDARLVSVSLGLCLRHLVLSSRASPFNIQTCSFPAVSFSATPPGPGPDPGPGLSGLSRPRSDLTKPQIPFTTANCRCSNPSFYPSYSFFLSPSNKPHRSFPIFSSASASAFALSILSTSI